MKRVLVVDDDRSMVRTLSDVLELQGWEVGQAYSGEDAVREAAEHEFDVVLMDVRMPGMDGVAALQAMRERRPGLAVVLMTAYAAQDRLADAERAGVWRVLSKPLDVASLIELLAAAREQSRPVLIVDSDRTFLRTLSEVLRLRGYPTVNATSLDQARRLIAEERPAAVLLHSNFGGMPVREGVERVSDAGAPVALILYSGRPEAVDEIEAQVPRDRIRAYLQKPFEVEEVMRILDAVGAGR